MGTLENLNCLGHVCKYHIGKVYFILFFYFEARILFQEIMGYLLFVFGVIPVEVRHVCLVGCS